MLVFNRAGGITTDRVRKSEFYTYRTRSDGNSYLTVEFITKYNTYRTRSEGYSSQTVAATTKYNTSVSDLVRR